MENIYMNYTELHWITLNYISPFLLHYVLDKNDNTLLILLFSSTTIQGQETFSRLGTVLRHECTEFKNYRSRTCRKLFLVIMF